MPRRASQAEGTANAKALRYESCLGECKKGSLELECGCRWVSKGRGSRRETQDGNRKGLSIRAKDLGLHSEGNRGP